MFKSIILSALRNFYRNRTFSLINIIGLSVSMSLSMLIILILKEQLSYDNFHSDGDRIYRINTNAIRVTGEVEPYASVPFPMSKAIQEEYSFADEVVTINRNLGGDAIFGNVNVPLSGLFADPSFLTMFNFPLEKGNIATALSEPNNLVLTKAAAERIFGKQEPLGQVITLSGYGEFTITGVLKEFSKTHLEFQALASTTAIPGFEKSGVLGSTMNNWNNYYGNYVYFKLKEGKTTEEVTVALAEISKKYYAGLQLETRDKGYQFVLHPLNEITPGPELSNQMGNGMPTFLLVFLGTLAGVVLLMSVFNFTNLMIAKSLTRAKEIGVRKVIGAQRAQVFLQFISETVLFSLIALIFSYVLLQVLKSGYLQLPLNEEFAMELREDIVLYIIFITFAIIVGVLAGLLPAGYLSAFKPVNVLKDTGTVRVYSRLTFRQILMVAQFSISVIFVIVVLVIYSQVNFMLNADYGFDQKDKLNVRLQGLEFDKLAAEVERIPGIMSVGAVSHRLGTWGDRTSDYKRSQGDQPFVMKNFMTDKNYVENLGLTFLAGKNFEYEPSTSRREVILNEEALKSFNFESPQAAVGQTIFIDDSVMLRITGVVKNFHHRPLNIKIGPVALVNTHSGIGFLSARIDPSRKDAVVSALEAIWKKLDPIHPIEYNMMEQEIEDAYRQAGMHDILIIVSYITFLAVTLACLGMLGMAMYSTKTRVKEVGLRKVMGASASDLVLLLSKSFMVLIGIALIIGIPISIFFSNLFLDVYAYKIEITPWLILGGVSLIVGLGTLIISTQTFAAANSNPVRTLRYE